MKVILTQPGIMKAKDINIGGVIFHIEENGYRLLENFLKEINEGKKECLAEIFLSLLSDSKLTIRRKDIELAIESVQNKDNYLETLEDFYHTGFRNQIFKAVYQQIGFAQNYPC